MKPSRSQQKRCNKQSSREEKAPVSQNLLSGTFFANFAPVPEKSVMEDSQFCHSTSAVVFDDQEEFFKPCEDDDSETAPFWHSRHFMNSFRRRSSRNSSISENSTCSGNSLCVPQEITSTPNSPNHKFKKPIRKTLSDSSTAAFIQRDEMQSYAHRSTSRRFSETVLNGYSKDIPFRTSSSDNESQRPSARRAAVVSTLPDSDLSCLSDKIASMQRNQPLGLTSDMKRSKWNFFKSKDKDRVGEVKLREFLTQWKHKKADHTLPSILQELLSCKGFNRGHNTYDHVSNPRNSLHAAEQKRQNAVWELFTSERTYLTDHLLVLQQVFMEPLQNLQCEGYLLSVDVRSVFGNLEEICKVSLEFCRALLDLVGDNGSCGDFGCADSIVNLFETFGSVTCPPYQRYCTSYSNSLSYREELKNNEEYSIFLKWCERNRRCQRLKLNDFLVAPMQHLTKYPLLLRNIAANTSDELQNCSIEKTLATVQESIKALEGKVTWLTHFQFLQDLQSSIFWPPVFEMDTKTPLPENLRQVLTQQPCRNLIANPQRRLVLDGSLSVAENGRTTEIYALLFDDLLMFTKPEKRKAKRKTNEIPSSLKRHPVLKDGTLLSVYRQPVALDRFMVYDVEAEQASSLGIKNAFLVVQENRFQQMTNMTMLQAPNEESKSTWLTQLASTAAQWMEKHVYNVRSTNERTLDPVLEQNVSPKHTVSDETRFYRQNGTH